MEQLGFDDAIDYKAADFREQFQARVPAEVDIVWDNAGGPVLNDLLARLALHARVVVCGGTARYDARDVPSGPENYFNLVIRRAEMRGILVYDYAPDFEWAQARIRALLAGGQLKPVEQVAHGFESLPQAFMGIFAGENLGKQIVQF